MILNVKGVRFSYKSLEVLKNIEFHIHEHEILSILGPNGVGKTTLLKCINSILKPDHGSILVDNIDMLKLNQLEIARKIAYVAQRTESSRLTAFDAILLGRYPHIKWKVSDKDLRVVHSIIRKLNLKKFSLRYIDELSGGELQKICTARALVQEPKILLLDEPTSSLDLKNQIEILQLIKTVVKEHKVATIMTMHDINMAIRYSDKLLFIKDGAIFAQCGKNEITEDIINEAYDVQVKIIIVDGHQVIIPQGV